MSYQIGAERCEVSEGSRTKRVEVGALTFYFRNKGSVEKGGERAEMKKADGGWKAKSWMPMDN